MEILALNYLLFVAYFLSPIMTRNFFLKSEELYSKIHLATLIIIICCTTLDIDFMVIIWPIFCIYGFALYLKNEGFLIFSVRGFSGCIPFIFSLISSFWYVAGVNDLYLLGYNKTWSFYAALHGSYFGWLFIGCLAYLSKRKNSNQMYLWGCYFSFIFFLLIAFGIYGSPDFKCLGVIGLTLLTPLQIGYFTFNIKNEDKLSKSLALISFFSIILSMVLAILNEFWMTPPLMLSDIPTMVLTHGFLNALVAIPCFYLAIIYEQSNVK